MRRCIDHRGPLCQHEWMRFFVCKIILLVSILTVFSNKTRASSNPSCWTFESAAFSSCFEVGDNSEVLLFLHGLGGNASSFWQYPGVKTVSSHLRKAKRHPSVLSISLGPDWLLNNVDINGRSLEKFKIDYLPKALNHWGLSVNQVTALMGVSMGGFNSTQVLSEINLPIKKWILLCPAISSISPHSPKSEVDSYILRTGANRKQVLFMQDWGRFEFPNESEWLKHSPLTLASEIAQKNPYLNVFISCGDKDEFGFFEGSRILSTKLLKAGLKSQMVNVSQGGHCSFSSMELVKFLEANN